jgi:AcrR family transcriptional regulator
MTQRPHKRPASPRRPIREVARNRARDVFRTSILEAAERVFARRGFHDTKVADIAREAKLAAGTLYNYFDSKDDIFRSLVEVRGAQALEEGRAIAAQPGTPVERLTRYVRWTLAHIDANATTFQVYQQRGVTTEGQLERVGGKCAADNYLAHYALLDELVGGLERARLLRAGLLREDVSAALAGAINTHVHQWLLGGRKGPLADRTDRILDLFLKGASRR